jgi:DNA phosphorothioation-associated putative methyltransferase
MNLPLSVEIERHKAAMNRVEISRPVKLAIACEILTTETEFFDYGCGLGGDVERLQQQGFICNGWDPYYFPENPLISADIVNLGYVINVIENTEERNQALIRSWELTKQVLIVSAQVLISNPSNHLLAYGDGVITKRNTFQKYYEQQELKLYIEETLEVNAIPVGLGIFFVFRDETQGENFRASGFYSDTITPKIRVFSKKFVDCEQQLKPLINFVSKRGRLPIKGELAEEPQLILEFGSIKRAFQLILTATNEEEWDAIAYKRSLDILVYLALSNFKRLPRFKKLSSALQADIKAFFGTYTEACDVAEDMLYSIGYPHIVEKICKESKIGKLLPKALYVHVSALKELDPKLRIYEGCVSKTLGRMNNATLVKFYIFEPKISYLYYPDFDTVEHPQLHTAMIIELQDLKVSIRDYTKQKNPPILHRKETFVTVNYPEYGKFAQLTQEEEEIGLLKNNQEIGNLLGWEERLQSMGLEIKDHHVYPLETPEIQTIDET